MCTCILMYTFAVPCATVAVDCLGARVLPLVLPWSCRWWPPQRSTTRFLYFLDSRHDSIPRLPARIPKTTIDVSRVTHSKDHDPGTGSASVRSHAPSVASIWGGGGHAHAVKRPWAPCPLGCIATQAECSGDAAEVSTRLSTKRTTLSDRTEVSGSTFGLGGDRGTHGNNG